MAMPPTAEELEKKVLDVAASWKRDPARLVEYLQFAEKFHRYSIRNVILIHTQNPGASFVASFSKYKELGYSVKKGEHGIRILAPTLSIYYQKPGQEKWLRLSAAPKKLREQIKEQHWPTRQVLTGFRPTTVFDVSQTTIPPEDLPKLFSMGDPDVDADRLTHRLTDYCKSIGVNVNTNDLSSISIKGLYNPMLHQITLNDRLQGAERLSVLSHELGHALMHSYQEGKNPVPSCQVELEADAYSIMLHSRLALPISEARKEHISDCYRAITRYNEQHLQTDSQIDIMDSIQNALNAYHTSIEDINQYIAGPTVELSSKEQETNVTIPAERDTPRPNKESQALTKPRKHRREIAPEL